MRKIGISNFQLPVRKGIVRNSGRLLSQCALAQLRCIASENIVKMTLRAVERAELYDCGHPLWNGFANCYTRIITRLETLNEIFPGIKKVIHNSEVKKGDVLVSDFHVGLNYGYMYGGLEPVRIRVLEVDGETVKGIVLQPGSEESAEVGYFKNELWFFISHKFTVCTSGRISRQ